MRAGRQFLIEKMLLKGSSLYETAFIIVANALVDRDESDEVALILKKAQYQIILARKVLAPILVNDDEAA